MIQKTSIFQFPCFRKHFCYTVTYNLILYPEKFEIRMGTQPPKYTFQLSLSNQLEWHTQKTRQNKIIIDGFGFIANDQLKFFFADIDNLCQFKSLLASKVMFKRIEQFYIPKSTLGQGATSRVLLVEQIETGKQFASKQVDKSLLEDDPHFVGYTSLFQEIQIMRELQHENIIKLFETYENEESFFLIMELMKGENLRDWLDKNFHQQNENDIKCIMKQLVSGVSFMHSKRIMHRDLKPENLMFKEEGNLKSLKIVDFGMATSIDVDKFLFSKCGTPGYIAPEVINLKNNKQKYGLKCDVFSMGAIFFKLVSGRDLFPGNDVEEILYFNSRCLLINLFNLPFLYLDNQVTKDLLIKMLERDVNMRINSLEVEKDIFFKIQEVDIPEDTIIGDMPLNFINQFQKNNHRKEKFQNS